MWRRQGTRVLATGVVLAAVAQGCASLGGPGVRACAPYLVGGAAIGAGVGASTSGNRDERARRGAAGAALGAAAGYAVCTQVWQQKQELETQFAALDAATPAPAGPASQPAERVVRSVEVVENSALRLDLNLGFATGQARLEPRVISHLQALAANLALRTNSNIRIIGHTDSTGDPGRNRTLSRGRADAVAAYLVQQGVASTRLETGGMGSDQPIADNATQTGRALNRRVEVYIFPIAEG